MKPNATLKKIIMSFLVLTLFIGNAYAITRNVLIDPTNKSDSTVLVDIGYKNQTPVPNATLPKEIVDIPAMAKIISDEIQLRTREHEEFSCFLDDLDHSTCPEDMQVCPGTVINTAGSAIGHNVNDQVPSTFSPGGDAKNYTDYFCPLAYVRTNNNVIYDPVVTTTCPAGMSYQGWISDGSNWFGAMHNTSSDYPSAAPVNCPAHVWSMYEDEYYGYTSYWFHDSVSLNKCAKYISSDTIECGDKTTVYTCNSGDILNANNKCVEFHAPTCERDYDWYEYSCPTDVSIYNAEWILQDAGGDCNGICPGGVSLGCKCQPSTPSSNNCVRVDYGCPADPTVPCTRLPDANNFAAENLFNDYLYRSGSAQEHDNTLRSNKVCPGDDAEDANPVEFTSVSAPASTTHFKFKSCQAIYEYDNSSTDGDYAIYPETWDAKVDVKCLFNADGGWEVLQQRLGNTDFYQNWAAYKFGFGDASNFWLGLNKMHSITAANKSKLRVVLKKWDNSSYTANYSSFHIGSELNLYTLSISGYSGTANDSLTAHNGYPFTTKDIDNDTAPTNCAVDFHGAWWYSNCHSSNLNGIYYNGGATSSYATGAVWAQLAGYYYSYKEMQMLTQENYSISEGKLESYCQADYTYDPVNNICNKNIVKRGYFEVENITQHVGSNAAVISDAIASGTKAIKSATNTSMFKIDSSNFPNVLAGDPGSNYKFDLYLKTEDSNYNGTLASIQCKAHNSSGWTVVGAQAVYANAGAHADTPTAPSCPETYLTFNPTTELCEGRVNMTNWAEDPANDTGDWELLSDYSVIQKINTPGRAIFLSDKSYNTFDMSGEMKVTSSGDNDWAGIVFGYENSNSFYYFDFVKNHDTWHSRSGRVVKVRGGTQTIVAWSIPEVFWPLNSLTTMRLQANPDTGSIKISVNGQEVVNTIDTDLPFSGKVGFLNLSQDNVTYSNFNVRAEPTCPTTLIYNSADRTCHSPAFFVGDYYAVRSDKYSKVIMECDFSDPSYDAWSIEMIKDTAKPTALRFDRFAMYREDLTPTDNYDPIRRMCVTEAKLSCPSTDFLFNGGTCYLEPTCVGFQHTDGSCYTAPDSTGCPSGFTYSSSELVCKKDPTCVVGGVSGTFNPAKFVCETTPDCLTGWAYNTYNGYCEKTIVFTEPTCPEPFLTYDPVTEVCTGTVTMDTWGKANPSDSGNWVPVNSTTVKQIVNSNDKTIYISSNEYESYDMEGHIEAKSAYANGDNDWMGIVFGYTGASYYYFDFARESSMWPAGHSGRLMKVKNGVTTTVANAPTVYWSYDVDYAIRIKAFKATGIIKVYLNGVLIIDTVDSDLPPSGKIGFVNQSQEGVFYSDFGLTTNPTCPNGLTYSPEKNKCYSADTTTINDLADGFYRQYPTCGNIGGTYDLVGRSCYSTPTCDQGSLDYTSRKCVANPIYTCLTGTTITNGVDFSGCSCPSGFTLNTSSLVCEKPVMYCDWYDPVSRKCYMNESAQCPAGGSPVSSGVFSGSNYACSNDMICSAGAVKRFSNGTWYCDSGALPGTDFTITCSEFTDGKPLPTWVNGRKVCPTGTQKVFRDTGIECVANPTTLTDWTTDDLVDILTINSPRKWIANYTTARCEKAVKQWECPVGYTETVTDGQIRGEGTCVKDIPLKKSVRGTRSIAVADTAPTCTTSFTNEMSIAGNSFSGTQDINSTNGVTYSFTPPNNGTYTFSLVSDRAASFKVNGTNVVSLAGAGSSTGSRYIGKNSSISFTYKIASGPLAGTNTVRVVLDGKEVWNSTSGQANEVWQEGFITCVAHEANDCSAGSTPSQCRVYFDRTYDSTAECQPNNYSYYWTEYCAAGYTYKPGTSGITIANPSNCHTTPPTSSTDRCYKIEHPVQGPYGDMFNTVSGDAHFSADFHNDKFYYELTNRERTWSIDGEPICMYAGHYWDGSTCKGPKQNCAAGDVFDQAEGVCLSRVSSISCGTQHVYNPVTQRCEKDATCPSGSSVNPITLMCQSSISAITCADYILPGYREVCQSSGTCPDNTNEVITASGSVICEALEMRELCPEGYLTNDDGECIAYASCRDGWASGEEDCSLTYHWSTFTCDAGYTGPMEAGQDCEGACDFDGCWCNAKNPPEANCKKPFSLTYGATTSELYEKRPLWIHQITGLALDGEKHGYLRNYECGDNCIHDVSKIWGSFDNICFSKDSGTSTCLKVDGCYFTGEIQASEIEQLRLLDAHTLVPFLSTTSVYRDTVVDSVSPNTVSVASDPYHSNPNSIVSGSHTYTFTAPADGDYTVSVLADDTCSIKIDGVEYGSGCNFTNWTTRVATLTKGDHTVVFNSWDTGGGPHYGIGTITMDATGDVLWNTKTGQGAYTYTHVEEVCPADYNKVGNKCIIDPAKTPASLGSIVSSCRMNGGVGWPGRTEGITSVSTGGAKEDFILIGTHGLDANLTHVKSVFDTSSEANNTSVGFNIGLMAIQVSDESWYIPEDFLDSAGNQIPRDIPTFVKRISNDHWVGLDFNGNISTAKCVYKGKRAVDACFAKVKFILPDARMKVIGISDIDSLLKQYGAETAEQQNNSFDLEFSIGWKGYTVDPSTFVTVYEGSGYTFNYSGSGRVGPLTFPADMNTTYNGVDNVGFLDRIEFWDSYIDGDLGFIEFTREVFDKDRAEGFIVEDPMPWSLSEEGFFGIDLFNNFTLMIGIDVDPSTCAAVTSHYGGTAIVGNPLAMGNTTRIYKYLGMFMDNSNLCAFQVSGMHSYGYQDWAVRKKVYTGSYSYKCSPFLCGEDGMCDIGTCPTGYTGTNIPATMSNIPGACTADVCDANKDYIDYCGKSGGCDRSKDNVFEDNSICYEYYCIEGIFNTSTSTCTIERCPEGTSENNAGTCDLL